MLKSLTAILWVVVAVCCGLAHAESGRFISADPLGHGATADLYSYAGGDPVNHFDPDGRLSRDSFFPGLTSNQVRLGQAAFAQDSLSRMAEVGRIRQERESYWNESALGQALRVVPFVNAFAEHRLGNTDAAVRSLVIDLATLPMGGTVLKGAARTATRTTLTAGTRQSMRSLQQVSMVTPRVTSSMPRIGAARNTQLALPAPRGLSSEGGHIRSFVQQTDQVFYRVSSSGGTGGWLTSTPPRSSAWAQEALSLPPGNTATMIQRVTVPAGTRLQRSRATPVPEWGRFRGGAEQFRLLDDVPAINFGSGVPLP